MFITRSMAPFGSTICSMMMLYDDSKMEARHLIAPTRNHSIMPLALSLKPRKVGGYGASSPFFEMFQSKKRNRKRHSLC